MGGGRAYTISAMAGSAELAATTERLLNLLPSWFGIPEANAEYVASAGRMSGLVALAGAEPIGVLLYRRHFPHAAEVHLMAVAPSWHRQGVGRALVSAIETRLGAVGVRLLQVKTLGASDPDAGYARTRAFYQSVGFLSLEETRALWAGTPCLIMVKSLPCSPNATWANPYAAGPPGNSARGSRSSRVVGTASNLICQVSTRLSPPTRRVRYWAGVPRCGGDGLHRSRPATWSMRRQARRPARRRRGSRRGGLLRADRRQ